MAKFRLLSAHYLDVNAGTWLPGDKEEFDAGSAMSVAPSSAMVQSTLSSGRPWIWSLSMKRPRCFLNVSVSA
jgi:hypothetical protein